MFAESLRASLNTDKRHLFFAALCVCVLLVFFTAWMTSARTPESEPEVVTVLLPEWSTFDHQAKEWIITAIPLQVARGNWQVRLQMAVIRETGENLKYDEPEWQDALVYGESAQGVSELESISALRHRNLLGELSVAEQNLLGKAMEGLQIRIRERDPQGATPFVIRLPAQPVPPGVPYLLDITFQARERTSSANVRTFTVTKRIWPVVLPSSISGSSIWLRADLHLHSGYSDGGLDNHLYRIRDVRLANRGYRIAYMTDHVGRAHTTEHLSRAVCICPPQGGVVLQAPVPELVPGNVMLSTPNGYQFHQGHPSFRAWNYLRRTQSTARDML